MIKKTKKKILILGARKDGHGSVVLNILQLLNDYKIVGFLDDNPALKGQYIGGIKVLGDISLLARYKKKGVQAVAMGIGDNKLRVMLAALAKNIGFSLVSVIHANSIISSQVKMGEGIFIGPGVIINKGVVIEDNVIINTAATVDHDCYLFSGVQIGPGVNLAGRVIVRKNAFLGTGAIVIPDKAIGENSIIGAGATVIQDVPDNVIAVGVPAKIIKMLYVK